MGWGEWVGRGWGGHEDWGWGVHSGSCVLVRAGGVWGTPHTPGGSLVGVGGLVVTNLEPPRKGSAVLVSVGCWGAWCNLFLGGDAGGGSLPCQ
jgi:hypothetical protein